MPSPASEDAHRAIMIEKAECVQNQAKPLGLGTSQSANETQSAPLMENTPGFSPAAKKTPTFEYTDVKSIEDNHG